MAEPAPAETPPARRRWLALPVLLMLMLAALPFALDTGPGRALLARWLPALVLENGLSFQVARIDGSIWRRMTLLRVAVHDQRGGLATIDRLVIDWRPLALIDNRIEAAEISATKATLLRLPDLKPTRDPRLLPERAIAIGRIAIARLVLAPGIAGPERQLRATGNADLAGGRARLALDAQSLDGGDNISLTLDAQPDRDRFALAAKVTAPAGGIITTMAGLKRPLHMTIAGRGGWQRWDGQVAAGTGAGAGDLATLAVRGRDGRFAVDGRINPAPLLGGLAAELLAGGLGTRASVAPDGDTLRFAVVLNGRALNLEARGLLDRADERLRETDVAMRLADTAPVARTLRVAGLRATARLAGPLLAPLADVRVAADRLLVPAGTAGIAISGVTLAGIADLGRRGDGVPLVLTWNSARGLPPALAPFSARMRATARARLLAGGGIALAGATLAAGPLSARFDASLRAADAWTVRGTARLTGWDVPGLGRSDANAGFALAAARTGAQGSGDVRFSVVRPTPGPLADGALTASARWQLRPGPALQLIDLLVNHPAVAVRGDGELRGDGTIRLDVAGRTRDYGPLDLSVGGSLARPRAALALARPGLGITELKARLEPGEDGWRIDADAQSGLGAVALKGQLATGPRVQLLVDRLALGDLAATGTLVQAPTGPFTGTLRMGGGGLDGAVTFSDMAGDQAVRAALSGRSVRLAAATPITIERLRIDANGRLARTGVQIAGELDIDGLERGTLVLTTAQARAALDDGRGRVSLAAAGNSGEDFRLNITADVAPDRYALSGEGTIAGRTARLAAPAVITRDDAGWHLAEARVNSTLGNATLGADWGRRRRIAARLENASLSLIGVLYPSINLAGRLSGDVELVRDEGRPWQGEAQLRLAGLSRSSITSTSSPIDVGVNARLAGGGGVMRAVIVRGGRIEGRAQARIGPLPPDPDGASTLVARLAAAPVAGALRYAGPAQDLWGLTGLTALDVRGDLAIAADIAGTLGDPRVDGRIRGRNARVEAPLLGAVATAVTLDARLTQSRLELTRFAGTSGNGSITGSGSIDLSLDRGFPLDIRMAAKDAALLGRDDVTATGSGTIRIATDEYGGVVSGNLKLARAEYRVGRTAVADVPVLPVTERNTRLLGRRATTFVAPTRWLFNLAVNADRRLAVTGMGIASEWQADVRVRGAATAPELFGRVQLVRGDYEFAGKRFQLTRGDIRFLGGNPPDPVINVAAETTANGITAQLAIDGTAQRPQIRFSSVPALPEDEVLSRVLFGARVTDLSAPEAIQLAGALASLRGGGSGFNPIGAVSRGLGIDRLRILPADELAGRRTTVAAGQYVGRNVYVELATDAQGYTATSIEIGLTRSLSILSSVATLGGTSGAVRWKRDY